MKAFLKKKRFLTLGDKVQRPQPDFMAPGAPVTAAPASSSLLRPFRLCIPPHTSATRPVAVSSLSFSLTHTHTHTHTIPSSPNSYSPVSGSSESTKPLLCLLGRELETEKKSLFFTKHSVVLFPRAVPWSGPGPGSPRLALGVFASTKHTPRSPALWL